jgi:hypothetical protein
MPQIQHVSKVSELNCSIVNIEKFTIKGKDKLYNLKNVPYVARI